MMKRFSKDFGVKVGLSDHTIGNLLPILSISLGATVIEKHFKLNDNVGGADASFSVNEQDFKILVDEIRLAELAMGEETYELTDKQISGKRYGRSLYVSEDIKSGDYLTKDNIKSIRPGFGLHPKYFNDVLGKKVTKNLKKGTRLSFNDISEN